MSNPLFEEAPASAGPADAKAKIEKQARQLAYDTKYHVKKEMSGATKMDPASVKRAYLERLQRSTASPAIKARAKQMLLGEDYLNVESEVENSVAKALFKVFVEGVVEEEIDEDISEEAGERKYFVRVTDKKTGNTYRRWATRSKITELRSNPNISSVELTEYGETDAEEKKKGAKTAAVKSGKGLDPVGKEDSDVDNDGKHNTKSDKYLLHRRDVRSKAIQNNEEYDFFEEKNKDKKLEVGKTGGKKVKNKVEVFPEIKVQEEVAFIQEKSLSKAQQRFMGMVYATKKGEKPASPEVAKAAKGMSETEAKKFAKTKHKGLPEKVKEETNLDEGIPAALAIGAGLAAGAAGLSGMMKSKRDKVTGKAPSATTGKPSLSDKMRDRNAEIEKLTQSYEPEGEIVDEGRGEFRSLGRRDRNSGRNRYMGSPTPEQEAEEKKRGDKAAERAKRQLARNLEREKKR